MSQADRAKKKAVQKTSGGWGRHRMNKPHRKGRKKSKQEKVSAERRLGKALTKET
jgi:hypothetical protein